MPLFVIGPILKLYLALKHDWLPTSGWLGERNGWLVLNALHPETGALSVFEPGRGFVPWAGGGSAATAERSADCYGGQTGPLPPALLLYPDHAPEAARHAA